jgi:hypothetical protein
MHRFVRLWSLLLVAAGCAAMLADCGKLDTAGGSNAIPTTSPSGSPSPSPGPCATMDAGNPNLVVVAMAGGISPVTVAPYPSQFGYGVSDTSLDIPSQAQTIDITAYGGSTPITTINTIQFFNAENPGSTTLHSAYGFKGDAFPGQYAFPSPAPSPTGTSIAPNVNWFTGRLATEDNLGDTCFSPEFKLSAGTYYFGDYDYYNSTNFRGVLVVATPGPAARRSSFRPRSPRRPR